MKRAAAALVALGCSVVVAVVAMPDVKRYYTMRSM